VTVLGAGREGQAAIAALPGSEVTVVADAGESILGIPIRRDLPEMVDVAIKSPGIPPHHPLVRELVARGVPITSGTDLWMAEHAAHTVGVTGSKGKSTTSSLIHALRPESALGGNIGLPLLAMPDADSYVVELSSYQCESLSVSPDVAVITSLFPEHLDWHGSVEQYYTDKLNLVRHGPRVVVANGEDADVREWLPRFARDITWVGRGEYRLDGDWLMRGDERIVDARQLQVRGRHNALNALIALAAADAVQRVDEPAELLTGFSPLEHRLEPIPDPRGEIVFVNDSLSTSPFATIEALKAFPDPGAVVLVGGQDRGVEYTALADFLVSHPIRGVVGLPPSGERILAELPGVTQMSTDMTDALRRALAMGATSVILSPGAPSYGVYRDHADRAEHFRAAIREVRT
jgi:UDP-N-acetylmuramoylalanine--D-glutamate ligase